MAAAAEQAVAKTAQTCDDHKIEGVQGEDEDEDGVVEEEEVIEEELVEMTTVKGCPGEKQEQPGQAAQLALDREREALVKKQALRVRALRSSQKRAMKAQALRDKMAHLQQRRKAIALAKRAGQGGVEGNAYSESATLLRAAEHMCSASAAGEQ